MSCGVCNTSDFGGPDGKDFVCFKCRKLTYQSGRTVSIRRKETYWEIHVSLPEAKAYWGSQWVAVSNSFEDLYEQYLARIIIS